MNKELEKLDVVKSSILVLGPYTVAELTDASGAKGWGLSIKSSFDRTNQVLGEKIAFGRAKKALYKKLENKKLNSQDIFSR